MTLASACHTLRSPTLFLDGAVLLILTNNIIIQKSQTINPVRCRHASVLIRKLKYGFKAPAVGTKGDMSPLLTGQQGNRTQQEVCVLLSLLCVSQLNFHLNLSFWPPGFVSTAGSSLLKDLLFDFTWWCSHHQDLSAEPNFTCCFLFCCAPPACPFPG